MNDTGFISILLVAIGLSADCFAVALGASAQIKRRFRLQVWRISLSFGLFQALMTVIGWLAGKTVVDFIQSFDHWIAFALLAIVGGRMIREALRPQEDGEKKTDITGWLTLIILSVATSIDALAMGLSFALLDINIVLASITIGLVSLIATSIGLALGRKANQLLGKRAEIVGGIILIAIAFRILLSHLL